MYFLSTNYGKKVQYFRDNPFVTVEIVYYSPDLSVFSFVALPGQLVQVEDAGQRMAVREMFIHLIKSKALSSNVLSVPAGERYGFSVSPALCAFSVSSVSPWLKRR